MEIDDVSGIQQWMEQLNNQRIALQAASRRRDERPTDRKSLQQLVNEFMIRNLSRSFLRAQLQHQITQSWVAPPYPPSTAALGRLQQLFLADLRLETHHRGYYILLRAATPSNVMTAVMAIMEDAHGDGVVFQLYQQKGDNYRTAHDVIQQGYLCIVKEPYFKIMNNGGYGLRVDHVTDLIWLSAIDERVPSPWKPRISDLGIDAMQLKEEGNRALKAGKLYEAAEIYTRALRHANTVDERRIIRLNRSLVNLKLRYYDQALQDAGADVPTTTSEKSLYRAAQAMYALGRYQESQEMLTALLSRFPNCIEAHKELTRTEQRLKEEGCGHYDFKLMYDAAKQTPPYIDYATYRVPVEIKSAEGRGRGLFTTRDVCAGEMILCEKAFSYCWASGEANEAGSRISLLMNTTTNRSIMGTQADLITEIVQKLHRSPSLLPDVNALHHGDYPSVAATDVDGSCIIDSFLIDRIISLNSFGCPRSSLENHFQAPQTLEQRAKDQAFHTCGLFLNASYINHSCNSNARRSFIGDMQIVRASRNIPENSEITFWYRVPDPELSYQQTQDQFAHWNFQCTCSICECNKSTPRKDITKRKALLRDLKAAFSSRVTVDLAKIERLLAAIEKTYSAPASDVPRLALWGPYLLLTRFYTAQKNHPKTIETAHKVLAALGYVIKREDPASLTSPFEVATWGLMQDRVIETFVHLWIAAYAAGAPAMGKQAKEYAKIAYRVVVGEDRTFGERYGKLGHAAMFEGKNLVDAFQSMGF